MEGENDIQAQLLVTLLAIQQSTNRVGAIPFPEYKGGMQDSMEWIESFEKTAQVNNYDSAARLQVVSAYLRDEPSYWFETQNQVNAFNTWDNFKQRFITQFRTPNKMYRWRRELEMRIQGPSKTVEQYAKDIRRLIKRLDYDNHWTNEE